MGSQQYCLRWNNHQANMLTVFGNMFSSEALVDVTLACEGAKIHAHKVVLSACSPFFQEIFMSNPCKHPVVILKDMKHSELKAILEFMYKGEVNVSQENLPTLLKSAENLKVKGLAEVTSEQQKSKNFPSNSSLQPDIENSAKPAHISTSHVSPSPDEVTHKKKRKRRKSDQHCDMTVNRICKSEDGTKPREDSNLPSPPNPHESYEQIESTLPQQSITSDMQNTHHHSPHYREEMEEEERILEAHEIKRSLSPANVPTNNPEYVLDPTSFMEQSLTTDQAYVANQSVKEPLSPPSSSSMIITASNDNSLDCSQGDSSGYVEDSAVQGPSHSSVSSGLSMQYESNANSPAGGLMMYVEPGTSSSGPSGSGGMTSSNRPGSPNKPSESDTELDEIQELPEFGSRVGKRCPVCHLVVHSKLQRHMQKHANEKKVYFCHICFKQISRKDHLKRHIREVHEGEKKSRPNNPRRKLDPVAQPDNDVDDNVLYKLLHKQLNQGCVDRNKYNK